MTETTNPDAKRFRHKMRLGQYMSDLIAAADTLFDEACRYSSRYPDDNYDLVEACQAARESVNKIPTNEMEMP
jgi:hypothetical protein